jgi:hypothetical protein
MNEKSNEEVAQFFNEVTDALGNHALHICATYGSCTSNPAYPSSLTNKYQTT